MTTTARSRTKALKATAAKTIKAKPVKANGAIAGTTQGEEAADMQAFILGKIVNAIQITAGMQDLDEPHFHALAFAIERVAVSTIKSTNPEYLIPLTFYAELLEALAYYHVPTNQNPDVIESYPRLTEGRPTLRRSGA